MDAKSKPAIRYFAYGSNLYTPRLRYRVKSCRVLSLATLHGHSLVFHKKSSDGSAKCDAAVSAGNDVLGVIYEINEDELQKLRTAEGAGKGYDETTVVVIDPAGDTVTALTYLASASHITNRLPVYSWYRDFVLMGCREHQLDDEYVTAYVLTVAAIADPDQKRDKRSRAEVEGKPMRPWASRVR